MLETIPTQKEFKNAIASLSPDQQRFCKAFRSMQLESTLFGVCVIQIKPQLEKLLKLPEDSLTKEIQLTQDLLKLFITYQIPSDLLSYEGTEIDSSAATPISRVKEYVTRMQEMLDREKKAELQLAQMEQKMRVAEQPIYAPEDWLNEDDGGGRLAERETQVRELEVTIEEVYRIFKDLTSLVQEQSAQLEDISCSFDSAIVETKRGTGELSKKSKSKGIAGKIMDNVMGKASKAAPVTKSTNGSVTVTTANSANINLISPNAASSSVNISKESVMPAKELEISSTSHEKTVQQHTDEEIIADEASMVDYTMIPAELERNFEAFDSSNALRPTIINPGSEWDLYFQQTLLSKPERKRLLLEEQGKEKNKAFDLLDALTKSGALSIDHAALHVVIASTHCFDKSIINTIIQDNINPIDKVESSSIIVASTILQTSPPNFISTEHLANVKATSPQLQEMLRE